MSEATFQIGGKQYTVACAPGEEAHVAQLGAAVDAKISDLGDNRAPREAQNLLFAALLIAEDLHQLTHSVNTEKVQLEQLRSDLEAAKSEADTASGQHDELKSIIADPEAELSSLQSSVQSAANESDDARRRITQLQSELDDAEQVASELRSGLSGLVEERDALQQEVEELRDAQSSFGDAPSSSSSDGTKIDPELVPALERFADLLENCADKLEGKAANT